MNGPIYILDKKTKAITTYLEFQRERRAPGDFRSPLSRPGVQQRRQPVPVRSRLQAQRQVLHGAHGRIGFVWIATARCHEDSRALRSGLTGTSQRPQSARRGRSPTNRFSIEWTDSNLRNATFEGTAREVLRVQLNHRIHPMGELVFHPTARRGDPEWRVMYIGFGDGGAGEMRTIARPNPQRLDTLVGKILRIIPDTAEHVATSTLSENGRYRIPNDNPFVSKPGVKKEIWAYGLRNPHRLSWAADPIRLPTPAPRCRGHRASHVGNGQPSFARARTTGTPSARAISCCNPTM